MKTVGFTLSMLALIVLLVLPVLHTLGLVGQAASRWAISLGTLGWFATAPLWMRYRP